MYIVYDNHSHRAHSTQKYGHFTVYRTRKAAMRRAAELNNSVYPRIDRWSAQPVDVFINHNTDMGNGA